ncbi:nitrilase-related carbon-nitrogen hydrolase [Fusobacterium sp. PH5-44]|uniref:nitrilase-related carbon-nitrogen hydrolase n=1 Tax=unclassified Fusobacterium TaxID=2648384 RepID=UPI003D23B1FE
MKISLEQMYPTLGDVEKNLSKIIDRIDEGIKNDVNLIIFPELSLTGYCMEEMVFDIAMEKVPQILLEKSREIDIVFGMAELGQEQYPYNSAFYLSQERILHRHRKVYLPNYGLFTEGRYFIEGQFFSAFDTRFGRMGLLVCEDAWHQSAGYLLAQDGAHIIINICNSPARLTGAKDTLSENWKSLTKASSISNGVYNIVVNRVGVEDGISFWGNSFIVSPAGKIEIQGDYFNEESIVYDLDINAVKRARSSSPSFKNERIDIVIDSLKRIKNKKVKL